VVVEAPDGPGALRRLDQGRLPGMDGGREADAVRRRFPGLSVLFITGYATAALSVDVQVFAKPFAPARLCPPGGAGSPPRIQAKAGGFRPGPASLPGSGRLPRAPGQSYSISTFRTRSVPGWNVPS
jgi:hypothetical protein